MAGACESKPGLTSPQSQEWTTFTGELQNTLQDARASLEPCNFPIKQAAGPGPCAEGVLTVNMGEAHLTDQLARVSRAYRLGPSRLFDNEGWDEYLRSRQHRCLDCLRFRVHPRLRFADDPAWAVEQFFQEVRGLGEYRLARRVGILQRYLLARAAGLRIVEISSSVIPCSHEQHRAVLFLDGPSKMFTRSPYPIRAVD